MRARYADIRRSHGLRQTLAVLAIAFVGLASCEDNDLTGPSETITSITVQIQSGSTAPVEGQLVTLRAIATFEDGTSAEVTDTASWSTASPGVTVSGNRVQARSAGAATIVAADGGVQGSIQLNVGAATIIREETVTLNPTFTFDLDAGVTTPADNSRDIWYEVETGTMAFLNVSGPMPVPIVSIGSTQPGRGGCAFATGYSNNRVPLASLTDDAYYCIRTNGDRYAEIRIDTAPGDPDEPIVFTYRLFAEP